MTRFLLEIKSTKLSFRRIHLNKLVRAFGADDRLLTRMLRDDIRAEIAKENGAEGGGGDFYTPFWRDAKDHVAGISDLRETTATRIAANNGRRNIYPSLCNGFLEWWENRRVWTNEDLVFQEIHAQGFLEVPELDATVKVQNLMGMSIGSGTTRLIYPFYYPEPTLTEGQAQLSLWALSEALTAHSLEEIRILDIIRANAFTENRPPFEGNEEEEFLFQYRRILARWDELREDYP